MNLKTSFFNKSIFKSDIKRCWWVALLETVILIFSVTLPLFNGCREALSSPETNAYWDTVPQWEFSLVILIIFGICVPTVLLSYLHKSSSVSAFHSMPIKRETMLSTKLMSILSLTIAPILINGVILALISRTPGYGEFFTVVDCLKWTAEGVIYTLFFVSLATVVNKMTGHPIGTIVFSLGFMAIPAVMISFLSYFFDVQVYGYMEQSLYDLNKYIYISPDNILSLPYIFIYPAMSVIFIGCAYLLYKKRKLENYGEVIAFGGLKPVFIAIVAILSSMLSYGYFANMHNMENILFLIPIGLIGTIIAWMVSRKSLSLKGVLKPVLIYVFATLIFCGIIHFDVTGYEKYVPDINDVESVTMTRGRDDMIAVTTPDGEKYTLLGDTDRSFRDREDIEKVIALHQYLIQRKNIVIDDGIIIPMTYKLKNGREITREYKIDYETDKEFLKPVYETETMKAIHFALTDGAEKEIKNIYLSDARINGDINISDSDKARIIEALKADIALLPYEEFILNYGGALTVNIDYALKYDKPLPYEYAYMGNNSVVYHIRRSYKNTRAVLEELGYMGKIPTADDIESAIVKTWSAKGSEVTDEKEYVPDTAKEVRVSDREELGRLYSLYDDMLEFNRYDDNAMNYNIEILYTLKNGTTFNVTCSYGKDGIPAELKGYF